MSNGRPWDPATDTARLRRLVKAGETACEIGRTMGRDPKFIDAKRRELGIEPGTSPYAKALIARLNLRRARRAVA